MIAWLVSETVEAFRLFGKGIFQPFRLARELREIHPDLGQNPIPLLRLNPNNQELRRHMFRQLWASVCIPWLVTVLVAFLLEIFALATVTSETQIRFRFHWSNSLPALYGWIAVCGLQVFWGTRERKWLFIAFVFLALAFILRWWFWGSFESSQDNVLFLLPVALGMALSLVTAIDVTLGVTFGVAFGVALGIPVNAAFGMLFSLVVSVAFGVTLGKISVFGVAFGVVFGVVLGVVYGIGFNIATGVAIGSMFIFGVLRIWFWIPELLWTALLYMLEPRVSARWILQHIPLRYDHISNLPLPLTNLLSRTYRQDRDATLETLAFLIDNTKQVSLIANTFAVVINEGIQKATSTEAIQALVDEFKFGSVPPSNSFSRALSELMDISKNVKAALQATTPFNQYRLMQQQLENIQALSKRAILERHRLNTPALHSTIKRWTHLLEETTRMLETKAQASGEIANPYLPGQPIEASRTFRYFQGREKVFAEIERYALEQGRQSMLLYGMRRMGKTSTLNLLSTRLGAGLVSLRVDLQGVQVETSAGLLRSLAMQMASSGLEFGIHLPSLDANELANEPHLVFQEWLTSIEKSLPNKRFILSLDEYETLETMPANVKDRALNMLRHIMQTRTRWIVLFCGAHEPSELGNNWTSFLIGVRTVRLGYLEPHEARQLIARPTDDFPDVYEAEAVETLVRVTNGHPAFLQILCHQLIENLNLARRNQTNPTDIRITVQDVHRSIENVFQTARATFDELWINFKPDEQNVLRSLALDRLADDPASVIQDLKTKGAIEEVEGCLDYAVPLFKQYMQRALNTGRIV